MRYIKQLRGKSSQARSLSSLSEVREAEWNSLLTPDDNAFVDWRFCRPGAERLRRAASKAGLCPVISPAGQHPGRCRSGVFEV